MKNTEEDSLIKKQLIFHEDAKTSQWRKDGIFDKLCWEYWMFTHTHTHHTHRENNFPILHTTYKCTKKIQNGCVKLLEVNAGENFYELRLGKDFLHITSKTQAIKELSGLP